MRSAVIYNFLIEANIMASIAILLMIPLRKFLRRKLGNTALCFGWLLVALRLLLPVTLPNPLISAIRSPFAPDEAIRPIAGQIKVRVTDALDFLAFRTAGPVARVADQAYEGMYNASLPILLFRIWLAGAVLVGLWFLAANIRFRLKLRTDRIEPISGQLEEQYRAMCAARGVKPVPVYFTDPLPSACLVGVFRPYIVLPLTASPADAVQVLTHEVCHLKNGDHLWSLLRLACCAVHWFNPLVWLAANMSRTDAELRCDDRVIRDMDAADRQSYANVLVLAASRRTLPGVGVLATGMTMTGRRLKERVSSVLEKIKPLRWLTVTFAVVASACLVGAFATSEAPLRPRLVSGVSALNPGRERIETEEAAKDFARRVWAMPELGGRSFDQFPVWNAWDEEDMDTEVWFVNAMDGEDGLIQFDMGFTKDGNLFGFSDYLRNEGYYAADVTFGGEAAEALAADLRAFVGAVCPGAVETMRSYKIPLEYQNGGKRMVEVAFYDLDEPGDDATACSAYFTVQIAPETVIVYYNLNHGAVSGNG